MWSTGKVFVLDSGFCLLQGIVELKKRGLFAAALIKKCRYWPKYVPGNEIIAHFDNKDVGDIDTIKGTMDGVPFHIHAMKEPDYIMMLMSTYGMTLRMGVTKRQHYTAEGVKKVVEFQYPEIVHNHYKFHDMIDNHNSFWMHPISMECCTPCAVDVKHSCHAHWMGQTWEVATHTIRALHTYVCASTPAPRPSQKPLHDTFCVPKNTLLYYFLVLHFITSSLP